MKVLSGAPFLFLFLSFSLPVQAQEDQNRALEQAFPDQIDGPAQRGQATVGLMEVGGAKFAKYAMNTSLENRQYDLDGEYRLALRQAEIDEEARSLAFKNLPNTLSDLHGAVEKAAEAKNNTRIRLDNIRETLQRGTRYVTFPDVPPPAGTLIPMAPYVQEVKLSPADIKQLRALEKELQAKIPGLEGALAEAKTKLATEDAAHQVKLAETLEKYRQEISIQNRPISEQSRQLAQISLENRIHEFRASLTPIEKGVKALSTLAVIDGGLRIFTALNGRYSGISPAARFSGAYIRKLATTGRANDTPAASPIPEAAPAR